MNSIFIAFGGGLVGFALSLLFYKSITLRMVKNITSITQWYILPTLKEMRNTMQILHNSGAKNYSFELRKMDILIEKAEEFDKSRKNII